MCLVCSGGSDVLGYGVRQSAQFRDPPCSVTLCAALPVQGEGLWMWCFSASVCSADLVGLVVRRLPGEKGTEGSNPAFLG